jgi:hypothetical protein
MDQPLKGIIREIKTETKGRERKIKNVKRREIGENASTNRANSKKKGTDQNRL